MLNHLEVIRRALVDEGNHLASRGLANGLSYQFRIADEIDASIDPQAANWLTEVDAEEVAQ